MANEHDAEIEALQNSPRITRHEDGRVTVALEYPIKDGDKTLTEITFSGRPKGKHLRAAGNAKNGDAKVQILLSQLSGLDIDVIEEMDAEDINVCAVAAAGKRKPSAIGAS
jgi:hypothetical protein